MADKRNAFARKWAKDYKGDRHALPNLSEVMEGIISWHVRQTEQRMSDKPKSVVKGVIRQTRTTY